MHSWLLSVPLLTLAWRVVRWPLVGEGARIWYVHHAALPFFLLRLNCTHGKFSCHCSSSYFSITEKIAAPDQYGLVQQLKSFPNFGILFRQVYLSLVPRIILCTLNILQVRFLLPFVTPSSYFQMQSCGRIDTLLINCFLRNFSECVSILFYHQIVLYLNIY